MNSCCRVGILFWACCSLLTAGIKFDRLRILNFEPDSLRTISQAVRLPSSEDYMGFGVFDDPSLPQDPDGRIQGLQVIRLSHRGQIVFSGVVSGIYYCFAAAVTPDGESVWLLAAPYVGGGQSPIKIAFDLQPDHEYLPSTTSYLVRLSTRDGSLISATRFPAEWSWLPLSTQSARMVVDSTGSIWLGGYARGPFPATPDATERDTYTQGKNGPGTLIRFAPDGSRITYATHLFGDAVAALAIDQDDNLYAWATGSGNLIRRGR
jgi:hypothetical protein